MEKEDLDLIPAGSRSRVFKVTFDYYTPRSHFALSEHHQSGFERVGQEYEKISPHIKREMIRLANLMISEYDLKGVFSIHCGSWTTTKHTFHAHICVDVEDYINLFYRKENEIPNWPSSRSYVTREWRASRNPRHYEINVRGYPYKDYFKDECRGIRDFIRREERREHEGREKHKRVCPATDTHGNFHGFLVVYHPSEPRVGFVLNTREQVSHDDQLRAMDVMYEFAEASKLTSLKRKGADKGCHICLVLDQQTRGFPLNSSQRLLGFIQVSGTKFYKDFCPDDAKESWFYEFGGRDEYKVYT